MRSLKITLVFALFLFAKSAAFAQDNSKIQATFIYNFTRLVSWPASYQSNDFVIGVLGSSPLLAELRDLAATKKAGSQTIVVKQFSSVETIEQCHILIVPSSQSRRLQDASAHVKSNSFNTLVVSDNTSGIKNGSVINFVVVDNRQRFELSENKAKEFGLTLGSEILRLAILTN